MSLSFKLMQTVECPKCRTLIETDNEVFETNITSNLCPMARAIGIYEYIWRHHENNIVFAIDLIPQLIESILELQYHDSYDKYNPKNGWGSRDTFLTWLNDVLLACIKNDKAKIWTRQ